MRSKKGLLSFFNSFLVVLVFVLEIRRLANLLSIDHSPFLTACW